MAKRQRKITAEGLVGSLEYAVLHALWREAPANVGAVLERINRKRSPSQQLAYTTVMTILARLHDKELVARFKVGRGYDYTPRFTEPQLVEYLGRQEVADLVDRYGQVALAEFAAALEDADPPLLARLRSLAEEGDGDA